MNILMFGRSGQVATEMIRRAPDGVSITALGRPNADLVDPRGCAKIVQETNADVIVNAAAYTAVDQAEKDKVLSNIINAQAPAAIANAAAIRGIPFIHISTDYVFDGSGTTPWKPDDRCAPLNAYGRTKRRGEEGILAAGGQWAILRTSWVFSAHGNNFVKTMLRRSNRWADCRSRYRRYDLSYGYAHDDRPESGRNIPFFRNAGRELGTVCP